MSLLDKSASKAQLIDILKSMKLPLIGAGGGFASIGTINFFDASVAPQGWLACDGTTYNIADYPDLATYYASIHGSSNFYGGDGTTTFAVPDLRGEFLRGSGTNSHTNQGDGGAVGEHQDGTKHSAMTSGGSQPVYLRQASELNYSNGDYAGREDGNYQLLSGSKGTSTSYPVYTSRPTNTSFLICVKATVAGDPNAHQYSTDEQIVGMTEDGEVLYEKTVNLQNINIKDYEYSLSFADVVYDCKASVTFDGGQQIFLNYNEDGYYCCYDIRSNKIHFYWKWGSHAGNVDSVRMVLQYTKSS